MKFRQIRYDYLKLVANYLQPKSIIEIGVATGSGAIRMLKSTNRNVKYTGYDVFDYSDKSFHKKVANGKPVLGVEEIRKKLSDYGDDITLIKGTTQETLWKNPNSADLVFLDGDHRIEAIRGDFEAVKESKVVVFDDYYYGGEFKGLDTKEFGCNEIVDKLDVIITPPTIHSDIVRLAIWTEDKTLLQELRELIDG